MRGQDARYPATMKLSMPKSSYTQAARLTGIMDLPLNMVTCQPAGAALRILGR
jgi:hypothetical protein